MVSIGNVNVAYDSGYTRGEGWGFQLLPQLCRFTDQERARVDQVGELAASALGRACRIAAAAMVSDDSETRWLRDSLLASVPLEHRDLAKFVMAEAKAPPRNFRLDLLADGTIAEVQSPGSGWGFVAALEQHFGIPPESSQIVRTYGELLGGCRGIWWLYNDKLGRSVQALVDLCQSQGVDLQVRSDQEFNPDEDDMAVVVKRPPFPMLFESAKGRRLLQRWMRGEVEIDPPPNCLPDSKHLLTMLHHPSTRDLFTADERGLCHVTHLVRDVDQTVVFGNGCGDAAMRIGDIAELEPLRRRVVVKYGGARIWERF